MILTDRGKGGEGRGMGGMEWNGRESGKGEEHLKKREGNAYDLLFFFSFLHFPFFFFNFLISV